MSDSYYFYPPPGPWPTPLEADASLLAAGTAWSPTHRSIQILPEMQDVSVDPASGREGFRIRLTAINPVNVDPAVFLYLAHPVAPGATAPKAYFQKVCSPIDLAKFPTGTPADGAQPPYFRLDHVECDFYTRGEAIEFRAAIAEDVNQLLEALALADSLAQDSPIDISVG